jgi:hypothetical protein
VTQSVTRAFRAPQRLSYSALPPERRSVTGLKQNLVRQGWMFPSTGLVAGKPKAGYKPAFNLFC